MSNFVLTEETKAILDSCRHDAQCEVLPYMYPRYSPKATTVHCNCYIRKAIELGISFAVSAVDSSEHSCDDSGHAANQSALNAVEDLLERGTL